MASDASDRRPPGKAQQVIVHPREYPRALRNPLKGFRPDIPAEPGGSGKGLHNDYVSVARNYIRWCDIESCAADGVDKIREFCDRNWADLPGRNVKVIPRVHLYWPNQYFWPDDLDGGDYTSPQFLDRTARLIQKLGEAWDDDPRVAFVHTGLIGPCGEQWNPAPHRELMKLMGETYTAAFRNKLCMIRYPWQFQEYPFGVFWDSWGCHKDTDRMIETMESPPMAGRWKTAVMGGEIPYGFGDPPGRNPDDTMTDEGHVAWVECLTRRLHTNHLGWIASYSRDLPGAAANADRLQKAFGYRFLLEEVRCPVTVSAGEAFEVSFAVRNVGSAPFYYDWPVEVSLLEPSAREPVWRATFPHVDIRRWLGGDRWMQFADWDEANKRYVLDDQEPRYAVAPQRFEEAGRFEIPADLPAGEYILALAILDPAGMAPSCRFATLNYFAGGRHPICRVGVGCEPSVRELEESLFDDPLADGPLNYAMPAG